MNTKTPMKRHLAGRPLASLLSAVLLSGAFFTHAASGPDTVDLTMKWPVGKRLVTRVTVNQTQQISTGAAGAMNQQMTQEQEVGLDVLRKLDDGGHELGLVFLAMKMDLKMGGASLMSYDSKKKTFGSVDPLADTMDRLMETRLKMRTDAKGEVTQVEGVQELLDSLSGGGNPMVGQILKGMFTEDSLKQMSGLPQGIPGKPVKLGDSWPVEIKMAMGPLGKLTIDMNYTFSGWEDHDGLRCVVLDYTGSISSEAGNDPNAQMALEITDGTMKGKSWFDPEAGLVRDTAGEQSMNMNIGAMGRKISMRMKQTVGNKLTSIETIPAY